VVEIYHNFIWLNSKFKILSPYDVNIDDDLGYCGMLYFVFVPTFLRNVLPLKCWHTAKILQCATTRKIVKTNSKQNCVWLLPLYTWYVFIMYSLQVLWVMSLEVTVSEVSRITILVFSSQYLKIIHQNCR
jgi:hypothetical protein